MCFQLNRSSLKNVIVFKLNVTALLNQGRDIFLKNNTSYLSVGLTVGQPLLSVFSAVDVQAPVVTLLHVTSEYFGLHTNFTGQVQQCLLIL